MVVSYKCTNEGCALHGRPIPDIQTLRTADGKGRVCSQCGNKMAVAETINVTGGKRHGGRRTTRR
jgi:hypothetical protein